MLKGPSNSVIKSRISSTSGRNLLNGRRVSSSPSTGALEWGNYRVLKLLDHVMTVLERAAENFPWHQVCIHDMQFGFMPGRSPTDAIFIVHQLQEKFHASRDAVVSLVFLISIPAVCVKDVLDRSYLIHIACNTMTGLWSTGCVLSPPRTNSAREIPWRGCSLTILASTDSDGMARVTLRKPGQK